MSRLRLGEGRNAYSMPDPDELRESYERVYRATYYAEPHATEQDYRRVLMLANGYLVLTTYALGQECCVGKLRDIWRARRARKPGGEE